MRSRHLSRKKRGAFILRSLLFKNKLYISFQHFAICNRDRLPVVTSVVWRLNLVALWEQWYVLDY